MYTQIAGLEIYYQKTGKGKDLIMLHGWGGDVSTFWPVVDFLKGSFTLYLMDLPGFGRSQLPKKPFYVSNYSEVVAGLIENLKLNKPIILGHSVGGRIAIKLAATRPNLLSKLILESSAGILPKRDLIRFMIYPFAKFFHFGIPAFFGIKDKLRHIFYKKLESDYITAGPMQETLTNILKEDLTGDLRKIKPETLLIWGANDPTKEASLKNGKKMYRAILNARIEVFENTGHFPHLEQPALFVSFVKDFAEQ